MWPQCARPQRTASPKEQESMTRHPARFESLTTGAPARPRRAAPR